MKKFILGVFVLSVLAAPALYAYGETGSSNKTVDAACVSTAVSTREDAVLAAWSKFDDAVTAALTARKTALVSAWALTDVAARKKAVREAWATAKKARRSAAGTYKTERKAAWTAFKTAVKACGGTAGSDASSESDSSESVAI
ncbi:hypothetical protein HZA26_02200 [Candidatus Nomurabacteria bacterium]|nr:hypothetical protein [Candidatus Nomurabacteria bacterium]